MIVDEILRVGYPFNSTYEFLSGGYWLRLESLHLTIGLLLLVIICLRILFSKSYSSVDKCVILYFSTALYTNRAYVNLELRPNEIFAVVGSVLFLAKVLKRGTICKSRIGIAVLSVFLIAAMHNVLTECIYPGLNKDLSTVMTRMMVTLKISVLAIMIFALQDSKKSDIISTIIKTMVIVGVIACLLYLLQIIMVLVFRINSYGIFPAAGFSNAVSFGSISKERGHLAKLMTPIFPFFLLLWLKDKWRVPMLLFVLVSMLNFSASGFMFFVTYTCVYLVLFYRRLMSKKGLLLLALGVASSILFIMCFWEQYLGIFLKITQLVFLGDSTGGRTIWQLLEVLHKYPLGMGYGGSQLRLIAGTELNMGFYVFIAQFSFLSPLLIFGYLMLTWSMFRTGKRIPDDLRRVLIGGSIVALFIYAADVLWFVPTIWAPLVFADRLTSLRSSVYHTDICQKAIASKVYSLRPAS